MISLAIIFPWGWSI
ncbi:Pheromone in Rtg/SHP-like quorum-sensing system RtgR/RtgS [Streptococcus pneumoniae]|nr:hypothetical protein SPV_2470 [Streptococcus pneumoniae]